MLKKSILTFFLVFLLAACSSEDSSETTSYVGPGSEYSITFDDGSATFDLTESDSGLNVTGTYTTLSTGFKKLTVGAVSGSLGPSIGDEGYGVDIPGVVFLLHPLEEDSEIIAMVSKGTCPSGDFNMNWIVTSIESDANLTNSCDTGGTGLDALGTVSFNSSTSVGTLPEKYDICNQNVGSFDLGTISCSSGIGVPSSDESARMYLTNNGGAIVRIDDGDTTDGEQIIVALPNDSITNLAALDGDYIGLVMSEEDDSGSSVTRVFNGQATIESGVMEFDEIDPETGAIITTNSVNGTLTFPEGNINTPNDGFVTGTYDLDTGGVTNKKTSCMFNENIYDSGKNFIFCVGQDPTDDNRHFNALFISK